MRKFIILCSVFALVACQQQDPQSAFGTLERDRILLTAPAAEMLVRHDAVKGSQVNTGQALLQLDATAQQLKVAKAQAEVQRAAAALRLQQQGSRAEQVAAATARVQQANLRLKDSERALQRAKQLRQQRLSAQAELDAAELAVQVARTQLADLEQQRHELQSGNRPEAIAQAEFSLESAVQSLKSEQKVLADLTVNASRDGLLEDLPYHVGERVPQGAVIAVILAADSTYARVYLPQANLSQFKVGQKVEVFADGITTPILGTVRKIASEASFTPYFALHQAERAHLMYLCEISLSGMLELPAGLPVQVHLPEAQHVGN